LTEPERLDLNQPRTLGPLLSESLRLYFRHFGLFVLIGFVIVAPAEAIVSGVGLEQFSSPVDTSPELAETLIPLAVRTLVTTPLIAAICTYVLLDLSKGERPSARRAIQSGLDAFVPVFVPVLIAITVEVLLTLTLVVPLAVAVESPLVPTLLVPLFFAIRWYFVPQAVVAGKARGLDALRNSWKVTSGQALRVAGVVLVSFLVFGVAAGLLATPIASAAVSVESGVLAVAADVFAQTLAAPAVAIVAALFYFDLRTRSAGSPS
jgi:hypothetical protein